MNPKEKTQGRPLTLLEISEASKKRVALISREFTDGFDFIMNYPRSVTFFGSARTKEGDEFYEKARGLARRIVEDLRYSIVTGGGPGAMEAANRGAYEAGGNSVGLTIELPHEQMTNKYITDKIGFHYFFSRKVCLSYSAEAFIFMPGGFGTLDEFTEILTLMQTNKVPKAPIILVGKSHWQNLEIYFKDILVKENFIEESDLQLYTITDNDDEILEIIRNAPIRIAAGYNKKSETVSNDGYKESAVGPISSLAEKHCVPCEGGTKPFSSDKSKKYLEEIDHNWTLKDDKELNKTYEFVDFARAMDFMNAVGNIAEAEGHHPDLKLHNFKFVDVKISTHAIGGLSENDFIIAAKIDGFLRDIQK